MTSLLSSSVPHTVTDLPDVALLLAQMCERFDRIERKLERLETVLDQVPGLMAMVTDTADGIYRDAAHAGIDIDERARHTLLLIEKLTEPATITALTSLLDKVEWFAATVNQAPGMLAMAMDVIDELYATVRQEGVDLEDVVRRGLLALRDFLILLQSPQFQALMASGVLDPQTLTVMGHAAHALVTSQREAQRVGPVTAAGALFRRDVQQSLGFALSFAGAFGNRLSESCNDA